MPAHIVYPAEGVHLAIVGEDVVTLDLNGDGYACLPEVGAHLVRYPGGCLAADNAPFAEELVASGLFSLTPPELPEPSSPAPPRQTSRDTRVDRGGFQEVTQFVSAVRHAERTFRGRGLNALVADGRPKRPLGREDDALVRRAVLFDRWLPWVPGQGLCLYRAYTLRRFLRSGGLDADWVFGVRTWPFSAHCWLQAGDLLLDDDLDRVALYTPILVS